MNFRRLASGFAATVVLAGIGVAAAPAAHAGFSTTRYASTTGSADNPCTQASPCDIVTAIDAAPADAEILLASGTYKFGEEPLDVTLSNAGSVTINAVDPTHPPTIVTEAGEGVVLDNSSISNVTIISTAPAAALVVENGSTVSHVAVYDSTSATAACYVNDSTVTDSLCAESGAGEYALAIFADGPASTPAQTTTLKNDTIVATGSAGEGLQATAEDGITVNVNAMNTIFSGPGGDLELNGETGSTLTTTLTYSSYRSNKVLSSGDVVRPTSATNVTSSAIFKSAGTLDFSEASNSPTIDKGGPVASGDTDLAGHARVIGSHADIGAYEYVPSVTHSKPKPVLSKFKLVNRSKHSATFSVHVNGKGLASKVWVIAKSRYHHKLHTFTSKKVGITAAKAKTITIKLKGLPRHKHFSAHAAAKSAGGSATTKAVKFKTK